MNETALLNPVKKHAYTEMGEQSLESTVPSSHATSCLNDGRERLVELMLELRLRVTALGFGAGEVEGCGSESATEPYDGTLLVALLLVAMVW